MAPPDASEVAGSPRRLILAVAGAAIVTLALYVRTLAPSIVGGDSGELISAARVLGVAHPPGYPTFTILAHLAGALPFGSPATGMNLLSALLDAAAVGIAVIVGLSILGRVGSTTTVVGVPDGSRGSGTTDDPGRAVDPGRADERRVVVVAGALAGAGLLAIAPTFWSWSLVTEVFPLNNLLGVAILGLMLRWEGRPERVRTLWLAAFLSGLALTNQQTIVLFAPGLAILYLAGLRRHLSRPEAPATPSRAEIGRLVGAPVGLLVVGLLPYLYLPLAAAADPAVNWGDPRTPGRLLAVISRQAYGTLSLTVRDTSGGVVDQLALLGGAIVAAVTPIGVILAAAGWWAISRASLAVGIALATLVVVSGPLFVVIANPPLSDPVTRGVLERFYLLPTIVVAILAGVGVAIAGLRLLHLVRVRRRRVAAVAMVGIVVAALACLAVVRLPGVDQSANRVAERYGRDILEPLPPDAILLTRSDENYTSVLFAQVVGGLRPDVVAIDVELLKLPTTVDQLRRQHPDIAIPFGAYDDGVRTRIADLVAANITARPVFVVGKLKEDLAGRFDVIPWGLTRRFLPSGTGPAPDQAARDDAPRLAALHPPDRAWPDTTWEGAIAADYGSAAFEDAHARQVPGPMADAAEIADLYRTALRLAPSLASADKNLGLLLLDNGGDPAEIVAVWRRFLALEPDDPDAAAIRSELARLSGTP